MTMRKLSLVAVLSSVVAGCLAPGAGAAKAAAPGEALEAVVAEGGLARLAWAGADLLMAGRPRVGRIVLEHEARDGSGLRTWTFEKLTGADPKVSFDAAARRLTYAYEWGSVSFAYAPGPDRLGVTVTITNRSRLPIADFEIAPLALRFPAAPAKPEAARWIETLPDRLGVVEASFGAAKCLLCCETVVPLHFGLAPGGGQECEVVLSGGVPMMEPGGVTYPPLGLPRVAPGESLTVALSLRFSAAEACKRWVVEPPNRELLADVYEAFRKYHQPRSVWPDRRPIGTIFVGAGKGPENNPRKWFGLEDVQTPEGKAELRKRFMELADRCIRELKKVNAQGMIVWDPEGAENPHPVTYIGDPRMVKVLAPEVEDIYPEFFRKFLDAGLRTGCCLRPTQVYTTPAANACDDDTTTRWAVLGFPQWIEVDLGSDQTIARTEIVCYNDRAYRFTIDARPADGQYRQVVDGTANTARGTVAAPITHRLEGVSARYLKLTITAPPDPETIWCSITEFRAFDAEGANLCLNRVAAFSSPHSRMASHGTGSHNPAQNPLGDDFGRIWPEGLPWWRFYPVVERLCRKIEYAKKNWGCTIFYVDTNGVERPVGEGGEMKWALLDSHVWRDVIRRHPDVLLIPELATGAPAQWAYAAQYLQPPYSPAATPPYVTELLGGAFSVCQSVNLGLEDWEKLRPELLDGVRRGDSLFFRGWFQDGFNAMIKRIYDEACKPGAIAPEPAGTEGR